MDGTVTSPGYLVQSFANGDDRGVWWPQPQHRATGPVTWFATAYWVEGRHWLGWRLGPSMRVIGRAENWPSFSIQKPWIQLLFLLVACLYGGLHCLAWNSTFPSHIQQLLWRISSLKIMASGFPVLFIYFWVKSREDNYLHKQDNGNGKVPPFYFCSRRLFKAFHLSAKVKREDVDMDRVSLWVHKFGQYLLTSIMKLLLCGYTLARTYLIVECFIQLVHLPPGPVFTQPTWSTYFPHIGWGGVRNEETTSRLILADLLFRKTSLG